MNSSKSHQTAVLLVNVGTPGSPAVPDVRKYLFQFLNDRRVIDLPWLAQKLLVNLIIVPFRAPKSSKLYHRLWTDDGSPLLVYSEQLKKKLQQSLGGGFEVFIGMRYGQPALSNVLEEIRSQGFGKIVVVPLFPQYASSTTGTVAEAVMRQASRWYVMPEIRIIPQFYDHPLMVEAFADRARHYDLASYDHILFSYHGLPNRQVDKTHPGIETRECTCSEKMPEHGHFCYRATCYETTRRIAGRLNLPAERYSVAFQSRLTNNWLEPFSDEVIRQQAKAGAKRILVLAPSFVADCLETIVEIGYEYDEIFRELGGEKVELVPSLNDHPLWVETLRELVLAESCPTSGS